MCCLELSAPRKARNLKASPNLSVTTSLELDKARVHTAAYQASDCSHVTLIMRGLWLCSSWLISLCDDIS